MTVDQILQLALGVPFFFLIGTGGGLLVLAIFGINLVGKDE